MLWGPIFPARLDALRSRPAVGTYSFVRIEDAANLNAWNLLASNHRRTERAAARASHEHATGPIDFSRYLERQNEEAARSTPPEAAGEPRAARPVEPATRPDEHQPTRYAPASPRADRGGYFLPTLGQIPNSEAPAVPPAPKAQQAPAVQHVVDSYHPVGTRVDIII